MTSQFSFRIGRGFHAALKTKDIAAMKFILIKYKKKSVLGSKNRSFSNIDFRSYMNSQDPLFEIMEKQICHFYPNADIHVLTNDKTCKDKSNITFHFKNFQPNHTCKFFLFGLLKEPAIYLDCDIVLFSKFTDEHLSTKEKFNLFSISRRMNLQNLSQRSLPAFTNTIYNAGLIFIKQPTCDIVDNLIDLHKNFFDDKEYITSKNECPNNDEYALSLFIKMNKMQMNLCSDVNVLRHSINTIDENINDSIQSLHYTGIKAKKQLSEEYTKFAIFNAKLKETNAHSSLTRKITLL